MATKTHKEPTDLVNQDWLGADQYYDAQNVEADSDNHLRVEGGEYYLSLDGVDDFLRPTNNVRDAISLSDFSISLLVRRNVLEEHCYVGMRKGGTTPYDSLMVRHNDQYSDIALFNTNGSQIGFNMSSELPLDEWKLLTITYSYSNGELKFYIDDSLDNSGSWESTQSHDINFSGSGTPFDIGRDSNFTRYFDGGLNKVRVYSRVLSAQEVSDLYNNISVSNTNLEAYYALNDGGGNTASDSSGNNEDATIYGGIWQIWSSEGYRITNPLSLDDIKSVESSEIIWSEASFGSLVPIMTDYTQPEGEVTYSTEDTEWGPRYAWKAFNRSASTLDDGWQAASTTGWVQYKFVSQVKVLRYTVQATGSSTHSPGRAPKDWTLEGSNDGTNYDTLDTQSGESFGAYDKKIYTVSTPGIYQYYRFNVTATGDGSDLNVGNIQYYSYDDDYSSFELFGNLTIYTAVTNNNTDLPSSWQEPTNGNSIPNISVGDDLTGKYLWVNSDLKKEDADYGPLLEWFEVQVSTAEEVAAMTASRRMRSRIF